MRSRAISSRFCIGWPRLWLSGVVLLWIMAGSALAQEEWRVQVPPPDLAARAALLMNPVTGEIVYAREPHLRLPPASTTKVLTAVVTLERLHPYSRVRVSPRAAGAVPSRIGLRAGEVVSTQDLLYGLLLRSGNDAAETLAEAAGGSIEGFSGMMNAKAWQIGARNSHFANPHGLPNDTHYSTAYDLALIFRHAMRYPVFADIVRTRNAALRIESGHGPSGDWRMVPVRSTNRLLESYEGARGGKTGFTLKARRCFVGEVERGGIRLIVVVLNSPNSDTLWRDTQNLLDYGFSRHGLAPRPRYLRPWRRRRRRRGRRLGPWLRSNRNPWLGRRPPPGRRHLRRARRARPSRLPAELRRTLKRTRLPERWRRPTHPWWQPVRERPSRSGHPPAKPGEFGDPDHHRNRRRRF
jgi:serine-type D-Ala-D-Ala carboxypeptidase (penicillin-binding protein 5/6)